VIYSGITDNGDVRARLQGTADDLGDLEFDTKYGHGLVDADEAAPPTGNQPPVADAGADQTALVGETVSFDGSDSEDPDGTIMSYEWDFGDGTTTTGTDVTTTYPYSTAGIYTVTLTVTDDEDATGTDTASVNITAPNEPPVADANGPYTGIEGDEILFNGSGSYDPDGTIVTYAWDFGDGSTGTGVSPTYTYKANGTYTVALTVNDGKVDSAPSPTTATISDVDPVASFTSDSPKPEGEVMSFTDTSTSYDGILWSWDFGDEGTSNAQNPTREYAQNQESSCRFYLFAS
jgi:PKD repeat protein